jgi:hypothetical protein
VRRQGSLNLNVLNRGIEPPQGERQRTFEL